MSLLRRWFDPPPPQPSDLLPNSKNLAMKRILAMSKPGERDREGSNVLLRDPMSELPEELPSAPR